MNPEPSAPSSPSSRLRESFAVPRQNRAILTIPERSDLAELACENSRDLSSVNLQIAGESFAEFRKQARREILAAAAKYTEEIGFGASGPRNFPLIVTGHQPELFHAGVWAKNFAAHAVADQTRGTGLNLIIDNDTFSTATLQAPAGTSASPHIDFISFDRPQPQQPWEEVLIADLPRFQAFGDQTAARIQADWGYTPLISSGWSAAATEAKRSGRLCPALTSARVAVERSAGVTNLEVPMSRVCETEAFSRFAAAILVEINRFHEVYNDSVRLYRQIHRLKSVTHPVPELDQTEDWRECPFWLWKRGSQKRERPHVRRMGNTFELRDSSEVILRFGDTVGEVSEAIRHLAKIGVRFRTRALTTTLFARIFLADLFIHGIGGAKYDWMTDRICQQFFNITPPPFATVSATLYLPLAQAFPVSTLNLRTCQAQLREIHFHPEKFLPSFAAPVAGQLIAEKAALISQLKSRRPTAKEHRRIQEINLHVFSMLSQVDQDLQESRDEIRRQIQANSVLQNREFSWCLQPRSVLETFFQSEFMNPH